MKPAPKKRVDQLQRLTKDRLIFTLMDTERELRNVKIAFEEFEGAVYRASQLAMRYKELLSQSEAEVKRLKKMLPVDG